MRKKTRAEMRLYYRKNRDKIKNYNLKRQKKRYEEDAEFRRRQLEYGKKYYRKHRKKCLKYSITYQKNRTKGRKFLRLSENANNTYNRKEKITSFNLWKIAKRQKMKCALTGEKLTRENISVDHIIPKSKGGRNVFSNIRLVTLNVNRAKSNQNDEEFLDMCRKVVQMGEKDKKENDV